MKTEVSVPDSISVAAQELAARLGVSLSELFTKAVSDLLARHQIQNQALPPDYEWQHLSGEQITARLNEVYEREPSELDPVIKQLQAMAIGVEEW